MARRTKGEGTLRKRKDGRWEGWFNIGKDENGKTKRKSVTAKTKSECQEKLNKAREEYLKEHIPGIGMIRPQASYLVFLDCRALGLTQKELTRLFAEKAHLALNDGTMFGQPGEGFMRLNIGCPRSVLKQALQQLREAVVQ